MPPDCEGHTHLRREHDQLRADHNNLYDRVRTNETKCMPAVEAAYEALNNARKVREEMHKHIAKFALTNSTQDLHMVEVIKRLDAGDNVRETALNLAIDTRQELLGHMIREEADRLMLKRVGIFVISPICVMMFSYLGWLGLQIIDITTELAGHHQSTVTVPSTKPKDKK